MGYEVDPGELDNLAGSLRDGSDSVEELGSAPGVPDAGPLSSEMGKLMSLLTGAAGELSTGVAAAADAVSEGGRVYVENEEFAERNLPSTGG
ncbi:hypothetical protein SAMN04487905_105220 [Actinopolyspora xinjiangensis]|uniref:Excreted virulence factor EspC, type VII ESX diderm n=1 Tax=Actinopolyspora xinjiangensis TaxID=405564 RepID=A0A1H0TQV8_9ACTN|nr:hypothetical protein [Actinopolyspora xinjiangensis]SDP56231.1 hypothetical protein SAMN04487905_105220 [Actinopolyspora xinjiangensis]